MKKFLLSTMILFSAIAMQAQEKVTKDGIEFDRYEMQIVSDKNAVDAIEPPRAITDCESENSEIIFTYKDVTFSGGKYGTLERTWIATDACGNTASAKQYIALRDLSKGD